MSGETRTAESGWTVDTLRVHIERIIAEQETRNDQRFRSIDETRRDAKAALDTALLTQEGLVQRAEAVNDKRFEAFTTARRASDDAARLMMPRTESAAAFANLEQQIRQLRESMSEQVTALRETMTLQITQLTTRADRNDGRSGGFGASWTFVIAAVGTLASIVMAAYAISRLSGANP